MARPRSIPDAQIYAAVRHLLLTKGEKSVSFGAVAEATGLAAASLVQRYGSRQGMLREAALAGWDALAARTEAADAAADSAHALLKSLTDLAAEQTDPALLAHDFRDAALRDRAAAWRAQVEAILFRRLRDRDSAAMLFAAWQGQMLWQPTGGKGFKLKDATKRLD